MSFQRDTRQVKADNAEVVTAIVDLFAVLVFPYAQEAAAAHRRFEGAGHFNHLIVVQDIRIHTLARALQRQLLDVIVRIAKLVVQTVTNRKHQFREHGGFTIFTQASNAVTQNGLLDQTRFPAGSQAETEGNERRLTVGGMQGIHFILKGLECVVALFLGTGMRITVGIWDLPLFSGFAMLIKALGHERCENFVNTVNGGTAINMAGNLRDNLRGDGRRGGDGFWRLNLRVTHLKALRQHTFQVDQHAVKHWEERRVVEIVIVNITTLVRLDDITRQQVLTRIVFGDDTGQQVALGRDHFAVFVGVFVQQSRVGLLNQTTNFLVQTATFFTLYITVVAIFDVRTGELLVRTRHQLVFYRCLDLVDIDLAALIHLATNDFCDGGTVICVIDSRCFSCTQNGFFDAL